MGKEIQMEILNWNLKEMDMEQAMEKLAMEILEMEMEHAMETQQSLKSTELTKARPIMDEESASKTRFTVETSCRAPLSTDKIYCGDFMSGFWPPAAAGLINASPAQRSRLN